MTLPIQQKIQQYNWLDAAESLNNKGYALLPGVINAEDCGSLIAGYNNPAAYRKTVVMERYQYGLGEYKYFNYPLPPLMQLIRQAVYTQLAPVANNWMQALNIDRQYPASFADWLNTCHSNGQTKPTVLILKYGIGGHNTLHQDLYGDIFFPIQAVLFLNEPGKDFTGGEFILTQQIPRAQSKAVSLSPNIGDMLLFTTNFRPQRGSKGYYRVNVKHGVSEVRSGERHTLGIIFHDALS